MQPAEANTNTGFEHLCLWLARATDTCERASVCRRRQRNQQRQPERRVDARHQHCLAHSPLHTAEHYSSHVCVPLEGSWLVLLSCVFWLLAAPEQ